MSKKINKIGFGGVSALPEFIITVKTDNTGTSANNQFTIPTSEFGSNYTVETSEQLLTNQTSNVTLTWATAGIYQVKISGDFQRIIFNNTGDRRKLLSVDNWGNINWLSFNNAFRGCENMDILATDTPILTGVVNMSDLFRDCKALTNTNGSMANWNTSNITSMSFMFQDTDAFNVDISNWNVSNVTSLQNAFIRSAAFNQNLANWNLRQAGVTISQIFRNSGMSTANYTDTLVSWANKVFVNNAPLGLNMANHSGMTYDRSRSGGANFADAGDARVFLTNSAGGNWTITNDTLIN